MKSLNFALGCLMAVLFYGSISMAEDCTVYLEDDYKKLGSEAQQQIYNECLDVGLKAAAEDEKNKKLSCWTDGEKYTWCNK